MEEIAMEEQVESTSIEKLSIGSWIAAGLSILFSLFLGFNSLYSFYKLKFVGEKIKNFRSSFFTETSLTWAHLIFGILFLAGIYITYLGIKEKKSFNIFISFVYTFALVSLFVSYIA